MNYKIIENFLNIIFQFIIENKIIAAIIWFAFIFFLLWKLSKKDNEFYLKDFFKKK
tara:strand:- start:383 stop:550 length:168 start_codon:yes stop_codon:yes gene_type:complete